MEETFRIEELVEYGLDDVAIGQRFGCSATSIQMVRKRHKIAPRRRALLTARAVAQLLGVPCSKTVTRWIEHGLLKTRGGERVGTKRPWYVSEDDLQRFLENRDSWVLWKPERIRDLAWREWALDMRQGTRMLTTGEVGQRLGFSDRAVASWIRKGLIPATRNGKWLIDEANLKGFVPPSDIPRRASHLRKFTEAEDRLIRHRMADGVPVAGIARELKRSISPVYRRLHYLGLSLPGRAS